MAKIRNLKVKDFPIDTIYDENSSSMKFIPALKYGINVFCIFLINCFLSKYNLENLIHYTIKLIKICIIKFQLYCL